MHFSLIPSPHHPIFVKRAFNYKTKLKRAEREARLPAGIACIQKWNHPFSKSSLTCRNRVKSRHIVFDLTYIYTVYSDGGGVLYRFANPVRELSAFCAATLTFKLSECCGIVYSAPGRVVWTFAVHFSSFTRKEKKKSRPPPKIFLMSRLSCTLWRRYLCKSRINYPSYGFLFKQRNSNGKEKGEIISRANILSPKKYLKNFPQNARYTFSFVEGMWFSRKLRPINGQNTRIWYKFR